MIKMLLNNAPAFGFFLSAASLATVSSRRKGLYGADRGNLGELAAWQPWAIVAVLAIASLAFGILCPDVYTAAMNDGFTAP